MLHQALLAHVAYARDAAKRAAAADDFKPYYNQHSYLVTDCLCPHLSLSVSISLYRFFLSCSFQALLE